MFFSFQECVVLPTSDKKLAFIYEELYHSISMLKGSCMFVLITLYGQYLCKNPHTHRWDIYRRLPWSLLNLYWAFNSEVFVCQIFKHKVGVDTHGSILISCLCKFLLQVCPPSKPMALMSNTDKNMANHLLPLGYLQITSLNNSACLLSSSIPLSTSPSRRHIFYSAHMLGSRVICPIHYSSTPIELYSFPLINSTYSLKFALVFRSLQENNSIPRSEILH